VGNHLLAILRVQRNLSNNQRATDLYQDSFPGSQGRGPATADLAVIGIDAFTELRWITIETQPGHFPI
jgi:hypothetical protein